MIRKGEKLCSRKDFEKNGIRCEEKDKEYFNDYDGRLGDYEHDGQFDRFKNVTYIKTFNQLKELLIKKGIILPKTFDSNLRSFWLNYNVDTSKGFDSSWFGESNFWNKETL